MLAKHMREREREKEKNPRGVEVNFILFIYFFLNVSRVI